MPEPRETVPSVTLEFQTYFEVRESWPWNPPPAELLGWLELDNEGRSAAFEFVYPPETPEEGHSERYGYSLESLVEGLERAVEEEAAPAEWLEWARTCRADQHGRNASVLFGGECRVGSWEEVPSWSRDVLSPKRTTVGLYRALDFALPPAGLVKWLGFMAEPYEDGAEAEAHPAWSTLSPRIVSFDDEFAFGFVKADVALAFRNAEVPAAWSEWLESLPERSLFWFLAYSGVA